MPRHVAWLLVIFAASWSGLGHTSRVNGGFFPSQEIFNGTTTLEEQATVGRDDPDRTRLFHNKFRPNIIIDNSIAGGGNLGVWRPPPASYIRPRPPNLNVLPPPPVIYDPQSPDKFYQVQDFQGIQGLQGPGFYPGDYVNPYPAYAGNDQCNIMGPLLALKKALFTVLKIAAVKIPVLALKFLTKAFAFLVLIGPLLLPLLLLFPVPVYGFVNNGFNLNTGFGNTFANQNPNLGNAGGNINLNRNPNQNLNNVNGGRNRGAQRALPSLAKGPCFPRVSCEMGYWGFQTQIAWILDHIHETLHPTFPKLFELWKKAYHHGGVGRDCSLLYKCPKMDELIVVAKQYKFLPEEP
ncbi:Hypothetical predicted protein [Cloeon dipterum]|uniref:Uncharacterized protein n=1 Tax=Cloeon dipterum TaxID=197152 RepID=A0A8S1CZ70_9INSE|nr:Hypothetical predicted protein [Cloeon dipterum]